MLDHLMAGQRNVGLSLTNGSSYMVERERYAKHLKSTKEHTEVRVAPFQTLCSGYRTYPNIGHLSLAGRSSVRPPRCLIRTSQSVGLFHHDLPFRSSGNIHFSYFASPAGICQALCVVQISRQ